MKPSNITTVGDLAIAIARSKTATLKRLRSLKIKVWQVPLRDSRDSLRQTSVVSEADAAKVISLYREGVKA